MNCVDSVYIFPFTIILGIAKRTDWLVERKVPGESLKRKGEGRRRRKEREDEKYSTREDENDRKENRGRRRRRRRRSERDAESISALPTSNLVAPPRQNTGGVYDMGEDEEEDEDETEQNNDGRRLDDDRDDTTNDDDDKDDDDDDGGKNDLGRETISKRGNEANRAVVAATSLGGDDKGGRWRKRGKTGGVGGGTYAAVDEFARIRCTVDANPIVEKGVSTVYW